MIKKTPLVLFRGILAVLFCVVHVANAQVTVEDYYKESDGKDWGPAFTRAFKALAKDGHGSLELQGNKTYYFRSCVELPRYPKKQNPLYVINGNGATLQAIVDSVYIFNRIPKNQDEALNKMVDTRFIIKDLSFIGGSKGINLGATFQTQILRCNFKSQKQAAVDIQFGLQTVIRHCQTLHCKKDNFVLRTGEDWGGSANNSQSNHSVIENCRVYAGKDSKTAYKILGSNGVVLRDIISEGLSSIDYAIYINRLNSTTVRLFTLQNLHLEHSPKKAAIYAKSAGITTLDGIYYQFVKHGELALVHAGIGADEIIVRNIPHWVPGTVMKQERPGGSAAWVLSRCRKEFFYKENWRIRMKKGGEYKQKLPYYIKGSGYRYTTNTEIRKIIKENKSK